MSNQENMSEMQIELLKRADTIFKTLADGGNSAKGVAMEQLPDIANQLITMNRIYLTVACIAGLIMMIISVFTTNKCVKSNWDNDDSAPLFLGIASLATAIFGVGFFLSNVKPMFVVWFAPKIFLITELITLLK